MLLICTGEPYLVYSSLPVSLQEFAFEIQGILSGRLDRMKLSGLRQIIDVLSAAVQDFRGFRYVHDPMHDEALKVRNGQRNLFPDTI